MDLCPDGLVKCVHGSTGILVRSARAGRPAPHVQKLIHESIKFGHWILEMAVAVRPRCSASRDTTQIEQIRDRLCEGEAHLNVGLESCAVDDGRERIDRGRDAIEIEICQDRSDLNGRDRGHDG